MAEKMSVRLMVVRSIIVLVNLFACSNAIPMKHVDTDANCRCFPGDSCWPTDDDWKDLNTTVGGRLIATVPLGSPCHDPTYNEQACTELKTAWPTPEIIYDSPYAVLPPLFSGNSCLPYTARDSPCTIGKNAVYAINVSSPSDVAAGLGFAESHNLRTVIKNTGLDLLGKSAGAGALNLWTYHLKDISVLDYSEDYYQGKAIKIGAGVQGWELLEAVSAQGLRVLSGYCTGIGVAGGFTQGGGHSPLSSMYGLAADNVLEWEVVTAAGKVVTASPTQNSDLYWALSGGGGSSYGVVSSMTMRAWPDGPVTGASVTLAPKDNNTDQEFLGAVRSFHQHLNSWTSSGAGTAHVIGKRTFSLVSLTWPDHTVEQTRKLLDSWLSNLDLLNMPYTLNVTAFSGFLPQFANYFGPLPYGFPWSTQLQAGRIIPRNTLDNDLDHLMSAIQETIDDGTFTISGLSMDLTRTPQPVSSNAVLPAWRNAGLEMTPIYLWNWTAPWDANLAVQSRITNSIDSLLQQIAPQSGTYMSEADSDLPTWKEDFFGVNYDRLRSIKKIWDPSDMFYARTAVGSDDWVERPDGRLCRK